MRNDVDALAGDLVRDRLHARTAHADAGADRIDARLEALHRDLGAHARIAGGAEDLDQALADFRHFELEELDEEFTRGAREEQLRAARLGAHFLQERLDAVLALHDFARNHVGARHEAFGVAAEVDVDAVAVDALDHARHQRADAVLVGIDHLGTLGFAHFLHDDLLGLLRGDAAERHRFHGLFDETADFGFLVDVERVFEAQLALRHFHLRGIVGKHLPAAERVVVAGLAVDGDAHVPFFAVFLARGRSQRRLERVEDDFLVDALLVRDGIDNQQNFFVHGLTT